MANQFPEVLPEVLSMPTTGWYCQTSGKARRRITKNTSKIDKEGIYNVKGVPGYTHNASAVVSVDADYSKYRDAAIDVPTNVWSVGALNMPVGLLTDSEEPDNASERYDRAIEKCVGYMSLFPENCTGHIREPTRSISEIRTLVAPKARLETLTYIDEMGGWRVPVDENDEKAERSALVSDFPDVKISVMPRSKHATASHNKEVSPSSLYIDFESTLNHRYRIDPLDAATGTIGWTAREYRLWRNASDHAVAAQQAATDAVTAATAAVTAATQAVNAAQAVVDDDALPIGDLPAAQEALALALVTQQNANIELARLTGVRDNVVESTDRATEEARLRALWDNTITFTWDADKRLYKSARDLTVVLNSVQTVYKANAAGGVVAGAAPATGPVFDGGDNVPPEIHKPRLTVTFPVMETTTANDGFCWLSGIRNEESLDYATRQNGLTLAPTIHVDILGAGTLGPFRWVGMPALRIPVGGKYALPGPDILQEHFGNGDATDVQYNFYDKFGSLTPSGLLLYQYRQQTAHIAHAAAVAANQQAGAGPPEQAAVDAAESLTAPLVLSFAQRALHTNGGLFYNRPGGFQKDLYAKQALLRDYGLPILPYVANANPPGAQIFTSGIREALLTFTSPQVLEAQTAQAHTAALTALTNAVDALNAAHARVQRLRVGGDPEELATARVAVETTRSAEAAARVASEQAQTLRDAAAAQNQLLDIDPFAEPVPCFKRGAATRFQGTCTFSYPVATFPAGNAPRFWQVGPTTQAGPHNFLSAGCIPLYFMSRVDNGLIPIAQLNGGGVTRADAQFIHHVPMCVFDITQVSADGTITCNYDFDKTMSPVRAFNSTANADGNFTPFVAGFSLLLGRGEDIKSNLVTEYITSPNLSATTTAQQLRTHYAATNYIGNKYPVALGDLTATSAGGVLTGLKLYSFLFATRKVSGLLFETTNAHTDGRIYMMYVSVTADDLAARVEYTTNPDGSVHETKARIELPQPKCVTQNNGNVTNFPQATFDAIRTANNPWRLIIIDEPFVQQNGLFDRGPFVEDAMLTQARGAVFQSRKRISQHVCGPILNPNMRIGAVAPLNYDSRHLPPELRDFRLQFYDIDWSRLQATSTTLNEITLYEFKDGTQKVGAEENVLYLPQFREHKRPVTDGTFEIEVYSELGCPSYFCLFCRSETTDILQQPIIKSLSLFNGTTKKKSNVVQDLSVSQLFHLTQRNVHPGAQYDKDTFRRRQTVLLSAEDIGLLGLTADEYQKAKRVRYVFSGTTDKLGQLYIVMVYNNRGLHIDGRRLQVVTLHE